MMAKKQLRFLRALQLLKEKKKQSRTFILRVEANAVQWFHHWRAQHPQFKCADSGLKIGEQSYWLRGDLDELLDELHPLAERRAEQHLGHHPQLHLVAALQQQLQGHRVAVAPVAAEGEVDEFLLRPEKQDTQG